MTPLRLELAGFTCFRERAEIDFTELELFAICGPTGAGKSTLLDAITYALYGQTARLGARGMDALLSPGADQLHVQLVFATARGTYRVTRTAVRRPSGQVNRETRIEELLPDASWRQLPESEKLKDADAKLLELVGLDYDGFTRAVLLPQGAFDEFLRGDGGKRRKLLATLLGLDRVEAMQKVAHRRSRDAEKDIQALRARLEEDYAGATPERLRELRDELATARQRRDELTGRQEALAAEKRELEELEELHAQREKARAELGLLREDAERVEALRGRVTRGRTARRLAPALERLETLQSRLRERNEERAALERALAEAEPGLARAQERAERAVRAAEEGLPRLQARSERLAAAAPLLAALRGRGGSLDAADGEALPYADEAWEANRRLAEALPTWRAAERALAQAEKRSAAAAEALAGLERERAELKGRLERLLESGKAAKEAHDKAEEALARAEREDLAAALRGHLHEGDACPVCRQTVRELPPEEAGDLAARREERDRARDEREEKRRLYLEARAAYDAAASRLEDRRAERDAAEAERATRREELAAAAEPFAAFAAKGVDEAARRIEAERRGLLAGLARAVLDATGGEDPEKARASVERERSALETERRAAETALEEERRERQRRSDLVAELGRVLAELAGDEATARAELEEGLAQDGFADREELRSALLAPAELERLEGEVRAHDAKREGLERAAVELDARLAGRSFDPERLARVRAAVAEVGRELGETQSAVGRLEGEVGRVEEQLERARELRRQMQEAQAAFDLYKALHNDLRGNAFPEFLMGQVQRRLAARASSIVRGVTDGRYDLRLQDGEYYVSDAWATGELRSAKTLSGGETFIASLALALALSDTIAGSRALGALFLDEGFGTLDRDTLDAVASVLEALTREGRMVGVISHVRDLTERLPARLTVDKGPDGSSVRWELA